MTNPRSDVRALEAALPLASRRELLVGLASGTLVMAGADLLSPASAGAATRTGPVTLDEFMELSEILTDDEFSLDDEPGALYLASLVRDPAYNDPLRQLVQDTVRADRVPRTFNAVVRRGALRSEAAARTAQQVLVLWYSGLVDGRTADYLEALAWQSLPFAEPPSTKIGFSKWDEAP
ncbi:sugar dehydrogenase complex small subunit [Nocardioides terrigena]|uniref:sugar dehydrogenase complex small subunit n=1 Tax=Nocardioides terrigena TaxID=424797 RepID=UPI000D301E55|nr:sugar dehydrogenase complex small subunit [Nocardioides terrigena]